LNFRKLKRGIDYSIKDDIVQLEFPEEYMDYSVVVVEIMNAKMWFTYYMEKTDSFDRMLDREHIKYIVMSDDSANELMKANGWDFIIVDQNGCFEYNNAIVRIDGKMKGSPMLMIDSEGRTICTAKTVDDLQSWKNGVY